MTLQTSLDHLENSQIVRRVATASAAAEADLGPAYRFKHTLTQDAAYRSLPRRQRELIHRRVAVCYEELFATRLDEYAAVLAFHYDEAGEDQKALTYCLRAAETAMSVYATAEAGQILGRALRIVQRGGPATSEQLVQLFARRGRALELESRFEEALENYRLQEQLAQARADRVLELAAVVKQTNLYSFINNLYDPVVGRVLATRALALAAPLQDRRSEAAIYWNLMNQARFDIGRLEEAIAFGERALEIARSIGWTEQVAYILNDIADIYADAGQLEQSAADLHEAEELWRELGNQPMLADSLTSAGIWRTMTGDFTGSIAAFSEANEIALRIQNIWGQAYSRTRGMPRWNLGEYAAAIADFEAGAALADEAGFLVGQILPRIYLALIYHEIGASHLSLVLAEHVYQMVGQQVPAFASFVLSALAFFHLVAGDEAKADRYLAQVEQPRAAHGVFAFQFTSSVRVLEAERRGRYEEAVAGAGQHVEVMRSIGVNTHVADVMLVSARALRHLGREDEARTQLEMARDLAVSIDQRRMLWQILPLLADLTTDPAEAAHMRVVAAEIMADVRDQLPTDELRSSFLALPDVRRTLDLDGAGDSVR